MSTESTQGQGGGIVIPRIIWELLGSLPPAAPPPAAQAPTTQAPQGQGPGRVFRGYGRFGRLGGRNMGLLGGQSGYGQGGVRAAGGRPAVSYGGGGGYGSGFPNLPPGDFIGNERRNADNALVPSGGGQGSDGPGGGYGGGQGSDGPGPAHPRTEGPAGGYGSGTNVYNGGTRGFGSQPFTPAIQKILNPGQPQTDSPSGGSFQRASAGGPAVSYPAAPAPTGASAPRPVAGPGIGGGNPWDRKMNPLY